MAQATSDPIRLPPGPRTPKSIQGLQFFTSRRTSVGDLTRRYGSAVTLNLPIFGKAVLISEPALVKDLFTTGSDLVGRATNLGEVLGPGSTFSLDGDEHRERRKLLVPPFHGKRMQGYEAIVEEEVMREIAGWPDGVEFETLPSMMHITLNAILRTVFGAEGAAFDELRETLPQGGGGRLAPGDSAEVLPPRFRPAQPGWGHAALSAPLRRDRRLADRRRPQRPGIRGTRRCAVADAAGALRRWLARSPTATSPTNC